MIDPINTDALVTAVTEAEGVKNSVIAFIDGVAARISTAVTTALEADNAADNTTVVAANAAIADVVKQMKTQADALTAAVNA